MIDFFVLIYIGLGILLLAIAFLSFQLFKIKKKFNLFFKKGDKNLEELLTTQINKLERQEKEIKEIKERVKTLEDTSKISFQKIGMVRFNPFKEIGSNQSFSIALLDKKNNGFVISSLYGREENRVYAKPIKGGESEYSLSDEEKEAIKKAIQ